MKNSIRRKFDITSGSMLDLENYRLVSLTWILNKVYEKLLRKDILCHVAGYRIY